MSIDLFRRVIGINQNLISKDTRFWEEQDKKETSRVISFSEKQ